MTIDALLRSIENGESLRVRYFGGSSPGGERELKPLSIKDGKLRAICVSSGVAKTFVIDKIELLGDGEASPLAVFLPQSQPRYPTLEEFAAGRAEFLRSFGWVIILEPRALSLHRTFKNGKLIRNPDVALSFEPLAHDSVFDGNQILEINHRPRVRPWVIRATKHATKVFRDFDHAQDIFSMLAETLAPRKDR